MSDRKRKAEEPADERPAKKTQPASPTNISVAYVTASKSAEPVVAHSPGLSLPEVKFKAYKRKIQDGTSEMLLHSSQHTTIDYTANEAERTADKHLKHYIAVFNPSTNKLHLIEAKKLTVRARIRQRETETNNEEEDTPATPNYAARAQLTQTFGTKKSKRAVQSMAENRLLASGGDENAVSEAILSGVAEDESTSLEYAESVQNTKPVPTANTTTQDISEVYPLSSLVFPHPAENTLASLPIQQWKARVAAKEANQVSSRFVATRITYLGHAVAASPDNTNLNQKFQLLRYILLLIEIARYVKGLNRKARIPPYDTWAEKAIMGASDMPSWLVPKLLKDFFPSFQPTSFAINLLHTTILAATLQIPTPSLQSGNYLVTDPTEIALDLGIDRSEITRLFRELGCKQVTPTEADLKFWGYDRLTKKKRNGGDDKTQKPKFSKLSFPIEFPKQGRGPPQRRR